MKIGLFYATYSGGTQVASEYLGEQLKSAGHEVTVKQIAEVKFEDTLNYDLRILATPSWDNEGEEGQPHVDFISFMKASEGKSFGGKNCAVFGLGDTSYTHFCGGALIVGDFVKKAGGNLIGEVHKIDNYLIDMDGNNVKLLEWAKGFTA